MKLLLECFTFSRRGEGQGVYRENNAQQLVLRVFAASSPVEPVDATPPGANLFGQQMNSNRNDRHFCLQ